MIGCSIWIQNLGFFRHLRKGSEIFGLLSAIACNSLGAVAFVFHQFNSKKLSFLLLNAARIQKKYFVIVFMPPPPEKH